jgi:hypothetical protein
LGVGEGLGVDLGRGGGELLKYRTLGTTGLGGMEFGGAALGYDNGVWEQVLQWAEYREALCSMG